MIGKKAVDFFAQQSGARDQLVAEREAVLGTRCVVDTSWRPSRTPPSPGRVHGSRVTRRRRTVSIGVCLWARNSGDTSLR
jgi:hypothetical protein